MLEDYCKTQPIAYKILKNSIIKNKISHAYLIEANGYNKKLEFAISLAKFLLCPNHKTENKNCINCNLCNRIDHGNFTELKIIEPDGLWIKKEQLEQLQEEFSKKSIESDYKIYIINGAEKLNASAANSILKFLEEPEPGIIAILITDNIYQILETIISRCQIISLRKTEEYDIQKYHDQYDDSLIQLCKRYSNDETSFIKLLDDQTFSSQIQAVINFVKRYETIHKNVLTELPTIWNPYFNDKEKMLTGLDLLILYYKDLLNVKLNRNIEVFFHEYDNFLLYMENNTQSELCEKIKILINMKARIRFNANLALLMDKLILLFEEVPHDQSYQSSF